MCLPFHLSLTGIQSLSAAQAVRQLYFFTLCFYFHLVSFCMNFIEAFAYWMVKLHYILYNSCFILQGCTLIETNLKYLPKAGDE